MNLSKAYVLKQMLAETQKISNRVRLLNKETLLEKLDKLKRGNR